MSDYTDDKKEQKTKRRKRFFNSLIWSWICLVIGVSVSYFIKNNGTEVVRELTEIIEEQFYTTILTAVALGLGLYSYKIQRKQTNEWEEIYGQYLSSLLHKDEQWNEVCDQILESAQKPVTNETGIIFETIKKSDNKDIIALMLKNYSEITEYFKISKKQAKSSYRLSLISSVAGICILAVSVYGVVIGENKELALVGIISGAIVEVISGTVLWIHNKSALQLNHYYDALHENEKFLAAINLAEKLNDEKREEMYMEIIRKQINSHS